MAMSAEHRSKFLTIKIKYQRSIAKIRLSSHNLSIETGRYSNTCKASRCCFSCADCVEDEYHCILVCPVYANFFVKNILKSITIRDQLCLNWFNCLTQKAT